MTATTAELPDTVPGPNGADYLPISAMEVMDAQFTTIRGGLLSRGAAGYHEVEVDELLDQVAATLQMYEDRLVALRAAEEAVAELMDAEKVIVGLRADLARANRRAATKTTQKPPSKAGLDTGLTRR